MALHYQLAGQYKAAAHLIGSTTAKVGVELFTNGIPQEEESDFKKPHRDAQLPYWVIVDSKGLLQGILHICRRFEYSKDVIVLVSEQTPQTYLNYLRERNYDYLVTGENRVDIVAALDLLYERYAVKTVLTDTGRVLADVLLNKGLVCEISLLVHPLIVGKDAYPMFNDVNKNLKVTLKHSQSFEDGGVWIGYTLS